MNKKILIAIVGLALTFWLLTTPQAAQSQGLTWAGKNLAQIFNRSRWRLGPLRLNAALALDSLGYDSDVYYGFFGDPTPDFTLSSSTPVQVFLPLGRNTVVEATDAPEHLFYLKTDKERAWNNTFSGQVHVTFKKFYVQAGGGQINTRRRMTPEFPVPVREKSDSLGGFVLWQASRITSLGLAYSTAKRTFTEAEFGGIDLGTTLSRTEDQFDVISYLDSGTRYRFFLDGRYGTYRFTEAVSRYKDSKSYSILGGVSFIAAGGRTTEEEALQVLRTGELRGSATLGYTHFEVLDPAYNDGDGLTGDINMSVGVMRATSVDIRYARNYEFAMYSGGTFYNRTTLGARLSRRMSTRITLSYDILFGQGKFPQIMGGGDVAAVFSRFTTHSLSLKMILSRNLTLTLLGTAGRRVRTGSGEVSTRGFLGLGLVYGSAPASVRSPTKGQFL